METGRENSISVVKDYQKDGSWVPVTPVKSRSTTLQPICSDRLTNQTAQNNLLEPEKTSEGNPLSETNWLESEALRPCLEISSQNRTVVACCCSKDFININREINNLDAILRTKFEAQRNSVGFYNNFSTDDADRLQYVPFAQLLALADTSTATPAHAPLQNQVNAARSSFVSSSNPQVAKSPFMSTIENPSLTSQDPLLGSKFQLSSSYASDICHCNEIRKGTEQLEELTNHAVAELTNQLLEIHNPDKGGSHGTETNKTPQQKTRRKRHRPKVVIEGQPKHTYKPRTATPALKIPQTGKRKYVRRNGLNKLATPTSEVTGEATDPTPARKVRKSCRRSLNFDFKYEANEESSSFWLSSNFDNESHEHNYLTRTRSRSTAQVRERMEETTVKTQIHIDNDITHSEKQLLEGSIPMPDRQTIGPTTPSKTIPANKKMITVSNNGFARGKCRITFSEETHDKEVSTAQLINKNAQSLARSTNDSNCSSKEFFIMAKQARGIKRKHPSMIDEVNLWTVNVIEGHNPSEHAHTSISPFSEYYNRLPYSQFPAVYKKKRTEKGRTSVRCDKLSTMTKAENHERQLWPFIDASTGSLISEISRSIPASHANAKDIPRTEAMQDIQHPLKCMLAFSDKERLTKKRSKVATRLRSEIHGFMQGCQNPDQSNTWIEALVTDARATMAKGKRTKRINSVPSNYNHQKFVTESTGPPARRQRNMSVNAVAEQFEHLNINAQSSQAPYEESNALVPYNQRFNIGSSLALDQMNGSLVSLERSFNQVRKQRPRPKVELDDETNRVWRLLLENINSEGIDGIDQEKAKWWEEERRVFRGRADSFIARMHLVQGDRRFSQWKGSVVDSVVGVFLTQNVSDHLSSSAFMSLAAHFPLKSKSANGQPHEERASISVKEPELCILDADDTIEWHEEQPNQPPFDQSFFKLQNMKYREEMEVSNQNLYVEGRCNDVKAPDTSRRKLLDSSKSSPEMYSQSAANTSGTQTTGVDAITIEDQSEMEDALSSQNSVVSSQNSLNISFAQTDEKICSCTQNNSEAEQPAWSNTSDGFGGSTFVELLQRAGSITYNGAYDLMNVNMLFTKSKYCRSKGMSFDSPKQDKNQLDDLSTSSRLDMPSRIYQPNMTLDSGVHELGCLETLKEENCTSKQSALSAESISQTRVKEMKTLSSREQPKTPNGNNNPRNNYQAEVNKVSTSQKIVEHSKNEIELQSQGCVQEEQQVFKTLVNSETLDVGGTTSVLHKHMLVGQSLNDLVGMNTGTSKPRRGRKGKEKQSIIDWDILRKQAQVNCRKGEKTENTMDSLDWEAVRQADVNEIAKTIKERGMNNRLAERIKDFLNRLVRDHGSVDLEWLRDVPPDKTKEYLLSIRGLGLKSVECVRLLTLHHLAFPVDTNVGRIAVRLGWVPLQPLPESLQLHLLELYPVLESIQKYLWPRLCKLDQRTLYELHYQMITFGKVFCTKSKPNCNACPMRGECRHFASAFASARLALPAAEDKSIVCGTETKVVDQSPVGIIHPLLLSIPQSDKQELLVRNSDPIVEVPTTPEPIVEVPGSPEPEQTQILESDIEDTICEDPDEIPTIKLNMVEFTQNLQNYVQQNMEIQEGDMSRALVSLTPEAASIPTPKLKNVSRLRTEHMVYELPDSHPLLEGLGKREPDDPSPYLLAIWTPGETADSIQPPERRCNFQDFGELCVEKTCFSCNSIREANSQTVRGTLLIPCRTAMRGSFPLNGTYFQVNEVFADHESSLNPIHVPRDWLWNLPRRTVYFGTSIPTIFKGLPTNGIQYCFWRGFVCVRGFDQKTRAPRPLIARLHFPASKVTKARGIADES